MAASWKRYLPLAASVVGLFDAGATGGAVGLIGGALEVAGEVTDLGPEPARVPARFVRAAARQIADRARSELVALGQADAAAVEDRVEQLVASADRGGLLTAAVLGPREFERVVLGDGAVAAAGFDDDARGYLSLLVGQVHGAVLRLAKDPAVFPSASTRALRDLVSAVAERPTWAQVRALVEVELTRRPRQLIDGDRPRLAPRLVPREQLSAVHAALGGGVVSVVSLAGMRGVGKSQLAAAYAQGCEHAGWAVVAWISAQTRDQVVGQLAGIARRAGLVDDDAPAEDAARAWVAWVSGLGGDRLLVLDNVEAVGDLDGLVPRGPGMRVLVTTTVRTQAFGPPVEVDVFTTEQAVDFLVASTGIEDRAGAAEVAEDLGRLPVALAQAASAITTRGYDFTGYRRELAACPLDDAVRLEDGGYPELAGAALWFGYQTVLEHLDRRSAALAGAARAVLGALTLLAESGVEREWLYAATDDELLCREAVGELIRGSLVTGSADGAVVSVHRLQAAVIRDDLAADGAGDDARAAAIAVLAAAAREAPGLGFHPGRARDRSLVVQLSALLGQQHSRGLRDDRRLLSLVPELMERLAERGDPRAAITLAEYGTACERVLGADHPDTVALRSEIAGAHLDVGDLGRAIPLFEAVLSDCGRVLGADHPMTFATRGNLAFAYRESGDLDLAIALHEALQADRERVLGADHPDTLRSRSNLAFTYQQAGALGRAMALGEGTLADLERVLGADHPDVLASRSTLAWAYLQAGDLGRAIALHEEVLADRERVLGADHPGTLAARSDLAGAYLDAGDVVRAVVLHEEVLAEIEQVLGADHPGTLTCRSNLASAYREAGDPERAVVLHEEVLADSVRVRGADHPDTLIVRNDLAFACWSAGDPERAIALDEPLLADSVRVLGADHPATLTVRNNLALAHQSAGDPERAVLLFESLLADSERVLGSDHPDVLSSRNNLAGAYLDSGDLDRASVLYEATAADRERVLGADHPQTLASRNNLAYVHQAAGDLDRAVALFDAVLADVERVLGTDHPDALAGRANLAVACWDAGDRARAVPLLESVLAECEQVFGTDHPNTVRVRDILAPDR